MEPKDTLSSCSVSKDQEIQRLQEKAKISKASSMNALKALQSNLKSLSDTLTGDIDFNEKYMIEIILHQQEIQQLLNEKKLQTQEVQINTIKALDVDLVIIENTCFGKENNSSETAFNKSVKESSLDSKTIEVHAIK
ncbi:hypothetical protein Tco_0375767 [Tanacetum coccineum]